MASPLDQIRATLLADATTGDWHTLWPRVMAARTQLLLALEGVSPETAARRPGTGEGEAAWSIAEVALHVLTYTRNVRDIIEATAHGRTVPKDPRGHLTDAAPATFDALHRQLIAESIALAALPTLLPEPPNLTTTVDHAAFGPLNSRAWFLFLTIHDTDHARQIRRLREQPPS